MLLSSAASAMNCGSYQVNTSKELLTRINSDILYCSRGDGPELSFMRFFESDDAPVGCSKPGQIVVLGVGSAQPITASSPRVAEIAAETNGFFRFTLEDNSVVICAHGRWH